MYCKYCGAQIDGTARECPKCGTPVEGSTEKNVLAIVGFVVSFFVSLAGLIISVIAYKQAQTKFNGDGKDYALAGTILSSISLALTFVFIIVLLAIMVPIIIGISSINDPEAITLLLAAL